MKAGWKRGLVLGVVVVLGLAVLYEMGRGMVTPQVGNFTGRDLNGKPWSLAEVRGRRPVLVNFFSTT